MDRRFGLLLGLALWIAPGPARSDEPPALPAARVRAWQTGMLAPDRLQHFSLSLTLGLTAGALGARPAAAFGGTVALGLAKEWHDRRRTRFDPLDLTADAAGAGLAAWMTHRLLR
jgi:hypothetical protein